MKKIAFVDLETSNLVANYGILFCGCIKELGGKTHTFRIDDSPHYKKRPWDDRWVAKQIRDCIEKFDLIITYYGKRFDKPYLNTKLIMGGMRPLKKQKHHDYWYTARFRLKLTRNSQLVVASSLLGSVNKTHIDPKRWVRALTGDRKAINFIVHHCKMDVKDLERIHGKLKVFMPKSFKRS